MKLLSYYLSFLLFIGSCSRHTNKLSKPNLNWTNFDEVPLYIECSEVEIKLNTECFTKILLDSISKKLKSNSYFSSSFNDTFLIELKIDTLGKLSVNRYRNKNKISNIIITSVEEAVESMSLFQPAFKTNLEIPVEVMWTLPLRISSQD